MKRKTIHPIGYIYTDFNDKFGVPRQSGRAPSAKGKVVFLQEYSKEEAVRGLAGVSHIWLIFGFDRTEYTGALTVRPPRLGGNKRVGVFASRSPNRPNGLGLSCVKLESVDRTARGIELTVCGADIVNGSPIYDVKPYNPADRIDGASFGFAEDTKDYKLKIEFAEDFSGRLPHYIRDAVIECLAEDPRPSYNDDPLRVYGMTYGGYNIKFRVDGDTVIILSSEHI